MKGAGTRSSVGVAATGSSAVNQADLLQLVANGEGSRVEFKRDDIRPERLAREISGLLNFEGGHILLGVEDDGTITGLTRRRDDAEEWMMNIARQNIRPPFIPSWSCVALDDGKTVAVVGVPADAPGKPYKARVGKAWQAYVRVGTSVREATHAEEARLYQAAQLVRFDIRPVSGTDLDSLDLERLLNYFRVVQPRSAPPRTDRDGWERLLGNLDLLADGCATGAGLLLFGTNPNRRLPQAGITAAAFPGTEKTYDTDDEMVIRGPLVSVLSPSKKALELGVIDQATDFVARNMRTTAWLEGGRRRRKKAFASEAVREAVVNAVAHRDYLLTQTDIEISLFADRLEVISPGRLPNGVTVEKMQEGFRAARNALLKEILRDYGYVEHLGMGVRRKIIEAMRVHNGTEVDLVEEDDRFIVRLWKGPAAEPH